MNWQLFPAPRTAHFSDRRVDLRDAQWIRLGPTLSASLTKHVNAIAQRLSGLFAQPLAVASGTPGKGRVFCAVSLVKNGLRPQEYRLSVDAGGAKLEAADESGLFYGLTTLQQLATQMQAILPACSIEDYPDFAVRGVMLDISRCKVPTMDTAYAYVDLLAKLKINQLQLYMEHTFAYSAHETVWREASPFTAQEIKSLDAYCKERYIELVPNQNSFGHFDRWLRHAEYRHLAELPDGFLTPWNTRLSYGSTLTPGAESLDFLRGLYRELLPNFTSGLFNVGCDETWELGQGQSKSLCEKKGTVRVYLDFLLDIHKLVTSSGKRMMFWGDIVLHEPGLIEDLPADIIALDWGYDATHPFDEQCRLFARSGVPFYVCPGTSSWNSLTGRTANCLANCANAAKNGIAHGALGYLNTDWGDGGHHQYQPISYLGIAAGAAYSWCYERNKDADVAAYLCRDVFGDGANVLGTMVYDLGKVLEAVPARPDNSTVFNNLLFWDMAGERERALKNAPEAALAQSVELFDELENRIAGSRPAAADGELVKAELRNAIAMARHGARRGLSVLRKEGDRAALRRDLQGIIGEHERLWLSRNRTGGLAESLDRLKEALKPLL